MEGWYSTPINMFLQKQLVSFVFVAITYYLLNRYSMSLVTFIAMPIKKLKLFYHGYIGHSSGHENFVREKAFEHYNRGQIFLTQGEYDQASREFRSSLSIDPRLLNGQVHLALAHCELAKGNQKQVLVFLEKALEWFPSISTLYAVGVMYNKVGHRTRARELFDETVRGYKVQLNYRRRTEWRWALLALCRTIIP